MTYLKQTRPQRKHKSLQSLVDTAKVPQAMVAFGAADALLRAFGLYPFIIDAVPQIKQELSCKCLCR